MTLVSLPLRIGIQPCGCIHESFRRFRVLRIWRCPIHEKRFVRAESMLPVRWCESCCRRRARYRMTFSDGVTFALCFGCELPRST